MEFPKRERAFPQGSPRRSPKATRPGSATGADENASPNHLVPLMAASPQRKKVLGERNDGGSVGAMEGAVSPPVRQPKPVPSPPTLAGRGKGPYDPKTNYTTPRPAFLRYDPEGRREIRLLVSRAAEAMHDDCSSATSGTAASEEDGDSLASDAAAASPISSAARSDSEAELDDGDEEEEVIPARRGGWARRLFLLLVAVSCSLCYIYCMNPPAFTTYSEDALDFVGGIGGLSDAGGHELDSLRLLETVDMMGPEDLLKGITDQAVHEDTKSVDHLYDSKASSRNLVPVTVMMGLADICLNVSLGELTCQIGSERSENVADLREDSEMDKLDTEVAASFQNDKQSSEVDCLDGNVPLDSISSTKTNEDEEGSSVCSESVHLEEWDDRSNQSVLQLVSMEKTITPASYRMENRKGLESEELDLWQYENTAEAAKRICSTVKFVWSAMEPHLLQILACLCFAGLVTALYRWYQRSRDCCTYVTTYEPLAEEPVLVPHQAVKLSVTSSAQDAQLPVRSPMELTLPKLGQVSLEGPVQETLPKTDPLVIYGRFLNHSIADSSKPPVVELLGEFTFDNSSRERSIKRSNHNAGDGTVQVHPPIIKSPSVRRANEEQEKSVKGKKTNATPTPVTPTPLRRSSRLRNKVTSP